MDLLLPYGSGALPFSLSETNLDLATAGTKQVPAVDINKALKKALRKPIGSPKLSTILQGKRNAVIVFSDRTRAYPAEAIITELSAQCMQAGIEPQNIILLCGAGAHTGNTIKMCREIVGAYNADTHPIVVHDAFDPAASVEIGTTSRGTPVRINRLIAETDMVILTGTIVPHYYAGYSGGRKGIMPGCASHEAILANHGLNFSGTAQGRCPNAVTGILAGNPVHLDMLEAARMAGVDFIVNTVASSDHNTAAVFCGDMQAAHEAGCRYRDKKYQQHTQQQFDVVLASAGGWPKDGSLYQAHKTIDNAYKAVKPGGYLIVAAECREGFGKESFYDWLRIWDTVEIEMRLREQFAVEGHTAYCMRRKSDTANIFLVSTIDPHEISEIGLYPFNRVEKAVAAALIQVRRSMSKKQLFPSILVIPDGSQFYMSGHTACS